jgi:hypothetical protein
LIARGLVYDLKESVHGEYFWHRKGANVRRTLAIGLAFLFGATAVVAQDVVSAVKGTVEKVDSGTKTAVVKTADGTEHTFHFVERTSVHGAEASDAGAKDAFHGMKEGSEVVVHYSKKGTEETAEEIDHVGKDGLITPRRAVAKSLISSKPSNVEAPREAPVFQSGSWNKSAGQAVLVDN